MIYRSDKSGYFSGKGNGIQAPLVSKTCPPKLSFVPSAHTLPPHIPPRQQQDLQQIVLLILKVLKPEKIILFGSYARGDFVEYDEQAVEGHIEFYQSDLDILVITRHTSEANNLAIWGKVERLISELHTATPVSVIRDSLEYVNGELRMGNSFYVDVVQQGVVLFERTNQPLEKPKKLMAKEKQKLIAEYLAKWLGKARAIYLGFTYYLRHVKSKKLTEAEITTSLNLAAFNLHQTAESAYIAAWLALTMYQPKLHDLEKLSELVEQKDKRFTVFARETEEGKRLFELLRKAYVDARYKSAYRITPEELKTLAARVRKLLKQVERLQRENNISMATR